jgi:serine/threonine protein kinase
MVGIPYFSAAFGPRRVFTAEDCVVRDRACRRVSPRGRRESVRSTELATQIQSARGRYEVAAELARGGMAVLHIARARGPAGFEKHVVLKRIAPGWADDHEFVEMFLNEARLAAALEHPHVVTVYDLGEDDDGPYLVMEYIHGVDLFTVLRTCAEHASSIPLQHAITIGIAVAGGLHHAHSRGIVHRDVSPRNVLVSYDGAVKIVDFGIAKAMSQRTQTRPSVRKGKVGYMSPEQCRGEPLTAASDVYALGVVLHELVTGRRLFKGEDEFAIMNAIVNRDADPPSTLRADLPSVIDEVIVRALARRPADRTASARELQDALEAAAAELRITPSLAALGDWVVEVCGRREHPWEQAVVTAAASVDSRDAIATRVEATPSVEPSRARGRWVLPAVGAAAVLVVGWAVWRGTWSSASEGRPAAVADPTRARAEPSEPEGDEPNERERAEPSQPERNESAPPRAEPSEPEPAEPSEPAQPIEAPFEPAHADSPTASAPEIPARDDAKARDARRRKTKSKPNGDRPAEPFDPDGLGPLPTLLDR